MALRAAEESRLAEGGLPRLLSGPGPDAGHEPWASHVSRLGLRPRGGAWLIDALAASGLVGKGGAGFPAWRKWEAMAERSRGGAVVLVNVSEGEPLSGKDRTLMRLRPHLVLDGAALAAESVGASEVVVYLSGPGWGFRSAVAQALRERRRAAPPDPPLRLVRTPHTYVAGESSAAALRASGGAALPRFTPPHVSERGVFERPTLVQNAETLAHVALIARYGSGWFRELGTQSSPGSTLVTLTGNVRRAGVYEIDPGSRLDDLLALAGGTLTPPAGALLGGYFGTWLAPAGLEGLRLDADRLGARRASLGCGVISLLPADGCALVESSRVLSYLARESAGQCGPCVHGLRALAETVDRVARSEPESGDMDRVRRWTGQIKGRGACHHPDGAVGQLESVLSAFPAHVDAHVAGVPCPGLSSRGFPQPPGGRR